jgi:ribosomal protein S27E
LIKSVIHLAETNVPSFRHIARDASASKVAANIEKIAELIKGTSDIELPSKEEILEYALEAKIQGNVAKIHEIVESLKHEQMEKGLKSKLAGAAMLGASMLPGMSTPANPGEKVPHVEAPNYQAQNEKFVNSIKAKNPFLYAVAMQESSGGANINHATIKTGMHKGHNAGGPWGIMPNTAAYILKKNPALAKKYPELANQIQDVNANHKMITDELNRHPDLSYDLADSLYRGLKKHHKGDINKISHSWYYGPNKTDELLHSGANILDDDYVKGVNKWYKPLKSKGRGPATTRVVKKALTAGYGGAGAPAGRTGGAVLQAESLDMGNGKGFKYVTCDGCGKEQIYSKFQVKCRNPDCSKTFSLEKLAKLLSK